MSARGPGDAQRSRDPFFIDGPAVISASGGRSSMRVVKGAVDAHGGVLPENVHVVFANTGREHPGTLDFVQECSERWNVTVRWLEYDGRGGKLDYREVTHETASRAGEPFELLIKRKRAVPNWQARWCTQVLKVDRVRAFMRARYESWVDVVGLRADEPARVARRRGAADDEVAYAMPLDDAGITADDVRTFWRAQPFDLAIPETAGNCTLCFMKGVRILRAELARDPAAADWWAAQEAATGRAFSKRWTYAELQAAALVPVERLTARQLALALNDEPALPCACTE